MLRAAAAGSNSLVLASEDADGSRGGKPRRHDAALSEEAVEPDVDLKLILPIVGTLKPAFSMSLKLKPPSYSCCAENPAALNMSAGKPA
jgi:hypothetical protein